MVKQVFAYNKNFKRLCLIKIIRLKPCSYQVFIYLKKTTSESNNMYYNCWKIMPKVFCVILLTIFISRIMCPFISWYYYQYSFDSFFKFTKLSRVNLKPIKKHTPVKYAGNYTGKSFISSQIHRHSI